MCHLWRWSQCLPIITSALPSLYLENMESRLVTNLSSPAVQPGHIPNYIKWSTQAEIHDQCHENKTIIFLPRSRKETQSIVWVYDNFGLYFFTNLSVFTIRLLWGRGYCGLWRFPKWYGSSCSVAKSAFGVVHMKLILSNLVRFAFLKKCLLNI